MTLRQNIASRKFHIAGETGRIAGILRMIMVPTGKRRRKAIRIEFEDGAQGSTVTGVTVVNDTVTKVARRTAEIALGDYTVAEGNSSSSSLWKRHFENIKRMRSENSAPVDSLGCHMLADKLAEPKVFRFQTLLSLMLSSQTKDQITAAAMHRLREYGCTVDNIIAIPTEELQQLLIPVGFYKKKAVYIKKVATILKEQYDSDIPGTVEELCRLPGVGEKMAYLAMLNAWDQLDGLGVDTHVHRISNRLGWVKTSNPKQTRIALEALIPREQWQELNKLLVGFGQQTCLPVLPKCSECLNREICVAAGVKKKR